MTQGVVEEFDYMVSGLFYAGGVFEVVGSLIESPDSLEEGFELSDCKGYVEEEGVGGTAWWVGGIEEGGYLLQ